MNWLFGLAGIAICGITLFGDVLPALRTGKMQHGSIVGRNNHPNIFWSFMTLFILFAAASFIVAVWQFWSVYQKTKKRNNAD